MTTRGERLRGDLPARAREDAGAEFDRGGEDEAPGDRAEQDGAGEEKRTEQSCR